MAGTAVVNAHGLVVAYDQRPVLRGVDLTVDRAEVVAILGANGSGKSTLVRAVLGLVPLVDGTVTLFGMDSRHRPGLAFPGWRRRASGRRLGYVPQRLGAGSGVPATVGEVVASGRLARRGPRPTTGADRAAIDAALAAVGLTERVHDQVGALSGGQQQRALIARALAAQPELLVLDEPTAGVDAASQAAFAEALSGFVAAGGTVLLVAHELGALHPLITRAVVVHDGRILRSEGIPEPAGHHALPDHDHVHPHAPSSAGGLWGSDQ
jgi:zinc transport system ATP-binding protein